MSAPIIPVPNAAILSTDTVTKKPVVVAEPAEVERATHDGLRSPWLQENTRRALADAVTALSKQPRLASVGPQPQLPGEEEVASNPRARSAKLRAARRLPA